jgi:xylan 1,4-beta-xylosidase
MGVIRLSSSLAVVMVLACWLAPTAFGSEMTLMEVGFEKPVWRELFKRRWGKSNIVKVSDGALRFQGRGAWHTRYFPYRPGTKISISVRAKSAGIKPGKRTWDVGRVVLTGVNGAEKYICSFEIASLQGNSEWKTYTLTKTLPDTVKLFELTLSNAGKAGTVWFDDLRMSVRDDQTEHLMGDPGFEGTVGVDHWFHRKRGLDWDNLQPWSSSAAIAVDRDRAVAGKRCVKLTAASTLVSKPFAYHGEELILSGWIRTKNIKRGKKGWCKAGVQIVGFNAQGKGLVHTDLILQDGTTGWTFYQKRVQFQAAVKKVQIWVRIFQGATGTAWFDEVTLQRIPFQGERIPFNAKTATLQIDAKKPGKLIKDRVWSGVDISYIARLQRKDQQDALPLLKKIGINMIRVRELSNALGAYNRDDPKTGKPIYNWKKLDKLFDLLVKKHGFIPNVTLESTPPPLARKGTPTRKHCNRWAPTDYVKWGRFMEAFMNHVIERYGKKEVEKWYWEVWNEPMAQHYYRGTPAEFAHIAEQAYLASERVEKRHDINLKMGLTSGGGWMNHYVLERLKKMKKLHLVEHYTAHFYLGARMPLRLMTGHIDEMKQLLKKYPGVGDCELGSTEWNCNSMGGPPAQKPWNATCVVKTVRLMLDGGLDYTTFFAYHDYPYQGAKTPTFNTLSMIALNSVPKPVYNAFVFLHELRGGKRLRVVSSNDPIDGLAVLMPNGAIRIVLTNYDEDTSRQPYKTKVTLEIAGAAGKGYTCTRHWAADNKHGNSYGKWLELGKPAAADAQAKAAILKASKYGKLDSVAVKERNGVLHLTLTVPSPGIRFIELKPTI